MENDRWYAIGIEMSENKHYLELENVVCYYNYPNANGREMDYGNTDEEHEAALSYAKTLVNMPLKAKYTTNQAGQPTFKGHEAKLQSDGSMTFGTEKIGTHAEVWIEERDVTTFDNKQMRLPCLVAKQIVWKDNKNVVAAIRRLFSLGKLNTSWEVDVTKYEYDNGIKYLKEYSFLGNALLGYEYASPAYGQDAKIVSLSAQEPQEDYELMIAEALSQDMVEKEVKTLNEEMTSEMLKAEDQTQETEVSAEEDAQTEAPEENLEQSEENPVEESHEAESTETEQSALTENDIRGKLYKLLRDKVGWGYIIFHFPEDKTVWYHKEDRLETEFTQVVYEIDGDTITMVSQEDMRFELPVRELPGAIAERDGKIAQLEQEVSELKTYKAQVEAAEAEKKERERQSGIAALRKLATDAACFTEEELNSPEMSALFEGLKMAEVKAAIFDKKMAQSISNETSQVQTVKENTVHAGVHQNLDNNDTVSSRADSFRAFILRK